MGFECGRCAAGPGAAVPVGRHISICGLTPTNFCISRGTLDAYDEAYAVASRSPKRLNSCVSREEPKALLGALGTEPPSMMAKPSALLSGTRRPAAALTSGSALAGVAAVVGGVAQTKAAGGSGCH